MRKIQNTKNSRKGSSVISAPHHGEPPVLVPSVSTPLATACLTTESSCAPDGTPIECCWFEPLSLKVTLEPLGSPRRYETLLLCRSWTS
jgi:hypothetical protein